MRRGRRSASGEWRDGVCAALAAACIVAVGSQASESSAGKIVLVVRGGMLAREEISPGSRSRARESWKLALEGTSVVRLDAPSRSIVAMTPAELRTTFLPPDLAAGGEAGGVAFLDFSSAESILGLRPPTAEEKPLALREVERVFGTPPPQGPEEAGAVGALGAAFREGSAPSLAPSGTPRASAPPSDLSGLVAGARVVLARIVAERDSGEDISRRDALLSRLRDLAGKDAHVLVVNLPEGGVGTAFLSGPRFQSGKVVASRKPCAAIAAAVARLMGEAAAGEEVIGEAFR